MHAYQKEFIEFSLSIGVLRFGEFVLKSGRKSPYFFNSGLFNTGKRLAALGRFYADTIQASNLEYDMVFGPAYKGIPLVSAVSIALAEHHGLDVPYAFNRKEAKDHGEGGTIVGAPLKGKVLIVDDVISAGTSVRESVEIIRRAGAIPAGVAISLDRQERGTGAVSAITEVEQSMGIPVMSIVKLEHIIQQVGQMPEYQNYLPQINQYRDQFGV